MGLGELRVWENGLWGVLAGFVEAVHVQLPDKAIHLVMSEVFRQHTALQSLNTSYLELIAISQPSNDLIKVILLHYIKNYVENLIEFVDKYGDGLNRLMLHNVFCFVLINFYYLFWEIMLQYLF